jgi:hypothetical protein
VKCSNFVANYEMTDIQTEEEKIKSNRKGNYKYVSVFCATGLSLILYLQLLCQSLLSFMPPFIRVV